jgi:Fic family protein
MNPKDYIALDAGRAFLTQRGYWAFFPAPLPPTFDWHTGLVELLAKTERSLAALANIGYTFPAPHIMVRPFIYREAVLSSRIEGTHTTLSGLYAYKASQMELIEASADAHEVHNYVVALEYGIKRLETLPVSLRLIREIHERLMTGVRGDLWTPGEFRRSQNWIGSPGSTLETATYVPPPVEEMHTALNALENFIHTPSDTPDLVKLALIHYQFEAIHPFLDGNGRIGRLLIVLLLCEWNILPQPLLYLSAYFERNRLSYYEHLRTVSQKGNWQEWLIFFLSGLWEQAEEARKRVKALVALREKYAQLLKKERKTARLMQVIDFLLGQPLLTIGQLQDGLDIQGYKTAQRYINTLESYGILEEITGKERNRKYRATEIIHTIEKVL